MGKNVSGLLRRNVFEEMFPQYYMYNIIFTMFKYKTILHQTKKIYTMVKYYDKCLFLFIKHE